MPSLTQKLIKKKQKDEFNNIVREKLKEWDEKHENEIDALILWELHTQLGFGYIRLRRFFKEFNKAYEALRARYECGDEDAIWVCQQKIAELGIDLKKWREEDGSGK